MNVKFFENMNERKRYFSQADIEQLTLEYSKIQAEHFPLMKFYISRKLSSDKGKEYLEHGFMRRINVLHRCIHNVYKIWPPDKNSLSSDEITDVAISVNAFVVNLYGSFDNLGHIWVNEKIDESLSKHDIGIMKKHSPLLRTWPILPLSPS